MKVSAKITTKLELEEEEISLVQDAVLLAEESFHTLRPRADFKEFRRELERGLHAVGKPRSGK